MAGDEMVMLRGCKNTRAVTVLLRGANDYMLDEMDRSLHDALSIVKRVLESGTVVAGEHVVSRPGAPGQKPGSGACCMQPSHACD